jgi:hypothetical protein
MNRFHLIDEAAVILRNRGVYRQAKVFRRGEALYASYGAGFVRLYKDGGTSLPNLSWDEMEVLGYAGEQMLADAHGKLSLLPKAIKQIETSKENTK